MAHQKGTNVRWKWGESYATGKITERFEEKVTRQIKGSEISKNGTSDCPAYEIEQEDGSRVLKLDSEVEKAN